MIETYPRFFSVNFLKRRIIQNPGITTLLVNKVRRTFVQSTVTRILSQQMSAICNVIVMTLPRDKNYTLHEELTNFISNHVEIVPNDLVKKTTKQDR